MHHDRTRFLLTICIFMVMVILFACNGAKNPITKKSAIEENEIEKSKFLIKLVTSIGVDEAQTEEEEPYQISSIASVDCDGEGNIFLLDNKSNCVRVYNKAGKFLRKMFRRGQGPQEIVNAYKIKYNPYSNTIFVLNEHGFKLKHFDLMGVFKEDILLPRQVFGYFEFTSRKILLYVSDCKYGEDFYHNIVLLDVGNMKIKKGFLRYSIDQRDDMFRHKQRFVILNNILWTSTIDTMDLKGIDISTGKVESNITIPGNFKKNIIYKSSYHGQTLLGLMAYSVAQPLILDNSLFVLVTIREYDLNKRPKWKVVSSPTSRKTQLYKVTGNGKVVKVNNFNQFDSSVLACTYKNRILLSSYKPYPHLKIVEVAEVKNRKE